jgi:G:T/U-mismatch repair DNA glycosylase
MNLVSHKFSHHKPRLDTEILILGTFNPNVPEGPDFFYGRPRNFLWSLLPGVWGLESLKEAGLKTKKEFLNLYLIDFVDLIDSLEVAEGEESNVDDDFIDGHVLKWKEINQIIETLPNLKAVYFTRKTFNGIPQMKAKILIIEQYCRLKGIRFCKLETPSRFTSAEKQQMWIDTILLQKICLRA